MWLCVAEVQVPCLQAPSRHVHLLRGQTVQLAGYRGLCCELCCLLPSEKQLLQPPKPLGTGSTSMSRDWHSALFCCPSATPGSICLMQFRPGHKREQEAYAHCAGADVTKKLVTKQ